MSRKPALVATVCAPVRLPLLKSTGFSFSTSLSSSSAVAAAAAAAAHPRTTESFSTSFAVSDHVFSPVLEPKSADRRSSRPFDVMHCACAGNAAADTETCARLWTAGRSIVAPSNRAEYIASREVLRTISVHRMERCQTPKTSKGVWTVR